MYSHINISHVFVFDQDEALDSYVGKLGLELGADVDLGFVRWLTVRVPGDASREILLEKPGPPSMDEASGEQLRELISKGASGFTFGLTTRRLPQDPRDAARAGRRVHRGTDRAALRHRLRWPGSSPASGRCPHGNHFRIVQLHGA